MVAEVLLDLFKTTLSEGQIKSQIKSESAASALLDILLVAVKRFGEVLLCW